MKSCVICLAALIIVSAIDMKYRKIPVQILAAMNIGAILYQCLCRREDIILIMGGAAAGVVFLFISRVTKEGVGYGDSLGILGLGIYVGLWKLLEILAGAFFILAICAVIIMVRKKMSRKYALPFYPFLTTAYALWMIGELNI